MTEVTLGTSGLWLGTRAGAGGTATLTESSFVRSPWLHGQQDTAIIVETQEESQDMVSRFVWRESTSTSHR